MSPPPPKKKKKKLPNPSSKKLTCNPLVNVASIDVAMRNVHIPDLDVIFWLVFKQ